MSKSKLTILVATFFVAPLISFAQVSPTVTSSFTPSTITSDGATSYTYSSTNATHCKVSNSGGVWDPASLNFPAYTYQASQFPNGLTTTVTCDNNNGTPVSDTKTLTVCPPSYTVSGNSCIAPQNNTNCSNLYWTDNTNTSCQSARQFCGSYMYQGLQTFTTQQSCLSSVATPPTATLTFNGFSTDQTNVDPLASRVWSWSATPLGSTGVISATLTNCDVSGNNGTTANWAPWTVTGNGSGASGSDTATPGTAKYGCTNTVTYTVTSPTGQTTSKTLAVTFKHAPQVSAPTASWTLNSGIITYGASSPVFSYFSINAENCTMFDTATNQPLSNWTHNTYTAYTFPYGILGTLTQGFSRKLICYNSAGVASSDLNSAPIYTLTVCASGQTISNGSCVSPSSTQTPTVTSSFTPSTITHDGNTSYAYSSTNATHCKVSNSAGVWDPASLNFPSYTYSAASFPDGLTTTVTCDNNGGTPVSDTKTLTVCQPNYTVSGNSCVPPQNNTGCSNLYWIDSSNTSCQSARQFCGSYMYQGLQTFTTQQSCQNAVTPVAPSATLTFNSFSTNQTNVDPLVSRVWSWSATPTGSTGVLSSRLVCGSSDITTNWTPWITTGNTAMSGASGSDTAIPGTAKYGCTNTLTYVVTSPGGQTTSKTLAVTFKAAPQGTAPSASWSIPQATIAYNSPSAAVNYSSNGAVTCTLFNAGNNPATPLSYWTNSSNTSYSWATGAMGGQMASGYSRKLICYSANGTPSSDLASAPSYTLIVCNPGQTINNGVCSSSQSATAPGAPTITRVTRNDTATSLRDSATITFAVPLNNGGSPITSYNASCRNISTAANIADTQSATSQSSPIVVNNLISGYHYSCTLTATNAANLISYPSSIQATAGLNTSTPPPTTGIIDWTTWATTHPNIPVPYSGKVIDENGNGLGGVTVTVYKAGPTTFALDTSTDSSGNWSFTDGGFSRDFAWFHKKAGYETGLRMGLTASGTQATWTMKKLQPLTITPSSQNLPKEGGRTVIFTVNNDWENDITNNDLQICMASNATTCTNFYDYTTYTQAGNPYPFVFNQWGHTATVAYNSYATNVTSVVYSLRRKSDPTNVATAILNLVNGVYNWQSTQNSSPYGRDKTGPFATKSCASVVTTTPNEGDSCPVSMSGVTCALDLTSTTWKVFGCYLAGTVLDTSQVTAAPTPVVTAVLWNGTSYATGQDPLKPHSLQITSQNASAIDDSSNVVFSSNAGQNCSHAGTVNNWIPFGNSPSGTDSGAVNDASFYGCTVTSTVVVKNTYGVKSAPVTSTMVFINGPATGSSAVSTPTGSLSVTPTSCTVSVGYNTCNVTVAWNTTVNTAQVNYYTSGSDNTYGIVTSFYPDKNTLIGIRPGVYTFHLMNGSSELAGTQTVTAQCVTGSHFDTLSDKCKSNSQSSIPDTKPLVIGDYPPQVLGVEASCVDLTTNIHRGAESPKVLLLQKFLVQKGFLYDTPTGFYGDSTVEAVKEYQKSINLPETGMVYDFTRQAIKHDSCN